MTTIPHPNNIVGWREFARRDDCLDLMTPSDLRQLLVAREQPLSRRDHFAGLAMQGMIASSDIANEEVPDVVSLSFAIADAMIEEGAK